MALLQRREERQHVVVGFVKGLVLNAVHVSGCEGGTTAATMLAMIHAVLLRYPRVRGAVEMMLMMQNTGINKKTVVIQEDDQVEDLAMKVMTHIGVTYL